MIDGTKILAELSSLHAQIAHCQMEQRTSQQRTAQLEQENLELRNKLVETQQGMTELNVQRQELEADREVWRHRWDETRAKLDESLRDFAGLHQALTGAAREDASTLQSEDARCENTK